MNAEPPRRPPYRLLLMALAAVSLLTGLWAGLVRLGWALPGETLTPRHGPLLVAGVLGVVIGLERAVALGRGWAYAAPLLAGAGGLGLIAGLPTTLVAAAFLAGSLVVVAVYVEVYRRRPEWATAVMASGALAWAASNALWLSGRAVVELVPWWAAFLVLTIVGERLELAQVLLAHRVRLLLLAAAAVLGAGVVLSTLALYPGIQVAGLGLLLLAAWLVRYDVARRTVRRAGLPRFSAVSLLVGYVWLGVAGLCWVVGPGHFPGAFWYDAMLHTLFLGFVFSMIFGHAPTIIPAVTGIAVPFDRVFYLHLGLLHGSLLVRILADTTTQPDLRAWAGLVNALAILVFAALTLRATRRSPGTRSKRACPRQSSLPLAAAVTSAQP
ncbi:MAG: hypothetical protein IT306_27980 [Chloroflexi bacterium]|nr:hypothetical protein [Chloroflexota bacterium]